MEIELTQTQLDAVQATHRMMGRGFDKLKLMNELLLELFPNEDKTFLGHWAGFRCFQLKGEPFRTSQEWILKDMIREVVCGSAQQWYNDWREECNLRRKERNLPLI